MMKPHSARTLPPSSEAATVADRYAAPQLAGLSHQLVEILIWKRSALSCASNH